MDQIQDSLNRWWHDASGTDRAMLLDAARNDLVVRKHVRDTLDYYLLNESGHLTPAARAAVDSVDEIER